MSGDDTCCKCHHPRTFHDGFDRTEPKACGMYLGFVGRFCECGEFKA